MSRPGTTQGGAGNGSRTRRRHWLVGGLVWGAVLSGLGGPGADDAEAQAQVRERTRPIVALDTGGHHAPVQAVAVTPDGRELISGGLDKVIGVWSIGDGQPERTRTIRPPIWRGLAGAIYALALSPPLIENPRQRLLAVAGFGVDDRRGNIALYRYPGVDPRPTGDLVAGLPSGGPGPVPTGHIDTVTCLAFSPDGKSLVSGSNDGRVLIWDVNRRTVVGELAGHNRPVNALAVTPDGRFVLTAGADGVLRIFDFAGRKEFSQRPSDAAGPPPGGDPLGVAINLHGLAVSPRDGRWAAIGREDGRMTLFEVAAPPDGTAALRKVRDLATGPDQGAVEAVAFSPDGTRLASSIVHQRLREPSELPSVACDIEIRDIPADRGRRRIAIASNLVYALAFHPDGRRLVFAGGDAQSITVSDLADPERPPQELAGQGSSLWDVGFRQDSRAIGFSRQRTGTGAPETFEGFDLFDRAPRPVARGELVRALESLDGWTVRPVDPYTLDVRDPDGRSRFLVRLDPLADRRWWSYSFIPGGPGHPDVTLAVGCEAGVAFFRLKDGRRTRLYAGHSGPVYALAPAPDGRWLVTGSSDQTARIWRLAGCDAVPPLGATFETRADGSWVVARVEPLGFADAMGLDSGDVVERCGVGEVERPPAEFLPRVDAEPPGAKLIVLVRRTIDGKETRIALNTTKRDAPVLSLFPGRDGEWVLWMPQGFYDASADGDRRLLGWHRNGPGLDDPTDFVTADKFPELRRRDVLGMLMDRGDPAAALALAPNREPARDVSADAPPVIRILDPPGLISGDRIFAKEQEMPLRIKATAEGARPVRSLRLLVDGRDVGDPIPIDPPREEVDRSFRVRLRPGRHRIGVAAVNDRDKERSAFLDVDWSGRLAGPTRLEVLAVGVGGRYPGEPRIPEFRFAVEDARDLADVLADEGRPRFDRVVKPVVIADRTVPAEAMRQAFAHLRGRAWGAGDELIVVLEAHVLGCAAGHFVVGSDAGNGLPPRPAVAADEVADVLAGIAATGCRVLLLVDGVHEGRPSEWGRLDDWIRGLYRRNVITFVASNRGPSRVDVVQQRRVFTLGVLEGTAAGARVAPGRPSSLADLQAAVAGHVRALTGRTPQSAFCYIPEGISPGSPWLGP